MAPVKHLAALLIVLSIPAALLAQISPVKPGFSSGSQVVAPGEIELGFAYEFQENASSENRIPVTSLRTGLREGVEVFLDWNGLQVCKHHGEAQYELPAVGSKVQLVSGRHYGLAFVGALAPDNRGSLILNPFAGLTYDAVLRESLEMFGALQFSSATGETSRTWEWNAMLGLTLALSDQLSLTGEWYNGYVVYTGNDYFVNQATAAYEVFPGLAVESYVGWSYNNCVPLFGGMGASLTLF